MTETEEVDAKKILAKPSSEWSAADSVFLHKLIKRGFRDRLKVLRDEVLLEQE